MNTAPPPPPEPQLPARRPFGSITLPSGPLPVPPPTAGAPRAAPARWQTGRVRLPPLSIAALRAARRPD